MTFNALLSGILLLAPSARAATTSCDELVNVVELKTPPDASALLARGVSASCYSAYYERTPLGAAVYADKEDMLRLLLGARADVNGITHYHAYTPAAIAVENGNWKLFGLLAAAPGFDANARAPERAPMTFDLLGACGSTSKPLAEVVKAMELLRSKGADMRATKDGDNLAVYAATACGDVAFTLKLRSLGLPLRSPRGYVPFCDASMWSDAEFAARSPILDLLVGDGTDVNAVAGRLEGGESPLMCAVMRGNLPLARFLKAHGADPKKSLPYSTLKGWANQLMDTETPASLAKKLAADPKLAWDEGRALANGAAMAKLLNP